MTILKSVNENADCLPSIPTTDTQLRQYLTELKQYFPGDFTLRRCTVSRGANTVGWFRPRDLTIAISDRLDTRLKFLSTSLHELAHSYGYQSGTAYHHDKNWYTINNYAINAIGLHGILKASRCHTYDLSNSAVVKKPVKKAIVQAITPQYIAFCQSKNLTPGTQLANLLYQKR